MRARYASLRRQFIESIVPPGGRHLE